MADFQVRGGDQLASLAKSLRQLDSSGEIKKQLARELREAGKPIAPDVKANLARLPRRGGLAADVTRRVKVGIRNSFSGEKAGVRLEAKHPTVDLASVEDGILRRTGQRVAGDSVADAVAAHQSQLLDACLDAVERAVDTIL